MGSNATVPITASEENSSHLAFQETEPRLRINTTHSDSAGPLTITSSSLVQIIHDDLQKSRQALSEQSRATAAQSQTYLSIIDGLTSVIREKDAALEDAQSTIRLLHGDQKRRVQRLRYQVYVVGQLKIRAQSKRSTELEGTIRYCRARINGTELALREAKKSVGQTAIETKFWKTTAINRGLALHKQSMQSRLMVHFCEADTIARFIFMAISDECDWILWGLMLLVWYSLILECAVGHGDARCQKLGWTGR
ncbi:hypothetical protein BDZ89DRAFT_1111153 [Hymenopellis radicata]|nr:hypothetical protein BDZ89DRAFT_1111153 [Hymenopellis radicata]